MFDAEKLSAARWAVRDILQYLKNNKRVKRTLVEKAVRRLNAAGFEDSASMLEAEFRPVFQGKRITTELSSSIQSLYDGVDAAISVRMNVRAATETATLKAASTTDTGTNNSTKQAEAGRRSIEEIERNTPELDTQSIEWIAARKENQEKLGYPTNTLATYRLKSSGGVQLSPYFGIDKDGRRWRRLPDKTEKSTVFYFAADVKKYQTKVSN